MHRIHAVALALFAAAALSVPGLSPAHSDSHAFAFGDGDDLNWAIVTDRNTSMSGPFDSDFIEEMKDRYGDRFVLIEDHGARYAITDRGLVARAQRAAERIGRYGREIGELARAQARLSLSESRPKAKVAKLRAEERRLERAIDRAESDGEPTDDLERELQIVTIQLHTNESISRSFALSDEERSDLTRRRDEAKERLHREVEKINDEMRDILRTARDRRLAERVD